MMMILKYSYFLRTNKLRPEWILVFFFFSLDLNAQQPTYYDINVAGINIGELEASQRMEADTNIYQLKSEVSFWFFGRIKLEYLTVAKYVDGQFIESRVTTETNKGNFISKVWRQGDEYQVKARTYKYELDSVIKEKIHYSAILLYFEEPKNGYKMLTENFGIIVPIIESEKGHFETLVDGNRNRYYYEDGRLERVLMQSPIKNYVVKRKSK